MKIVCEACAAKYSISDDKVRGKVFKIRCKKCSHIIVVRGSGDAAEGGAPEAEAPQAPAPVAAAPEGVWYVVIEGEQVGPLTESDVGGRISRGEISGETFAWREGMADWIQVSAIAEFASVLDAAPASGGYEDRDSPFAPQPTAVYPPGTAESMFGDRAEATPAPAANGTGKRSEATEIFGAPTSVAHPPAGQDLFAPQGAEDPFAPAPTAVAAASMRAPSSPGPASGGGGGFFNVPAAASPSGGASPAAAMGGLTAQRSENSVLFSLSNLEALAAPAPAAPSGGGFATGASPGLGSTSTVSDGSGLIDIRSMAAMTLGKPQASDSPFGGPLAPPSAPELPTFSAAPLSPMAPMLVPTRAASGVPTYAYVLGGLVVVLLGGLTWAVLSKPEAPAVAPAPTAAPAPAAVAATAPAVPVTPPPTPAETPPPPKEEALPPREEAPATASEKSSGSSSGAKKSSGGAKKPSGATAKAPAEETPKQAAPAPAPTPAPAPEAPKKGSLDDLLAGAIGGSPKKSAPAAAPAPAAEPTKKLGPLAKSDIVKGMMGVLPKTKACYDQYKVPGTANVTIKVGGSGKVDDAQVTGKFAGTPTGECVEKAVKTAKFPPSDGLTFPYPIPLR